MEEENKKNGRYYYLMLKENYFESDDIVFLESMDNGYLYSNILLKLYLKSLKDKGRLMYKDRIPYNAKMISQITRHNIDVVEKAIKVFKELHILDILDNGAIYMLDIENFIGKSSNNADRQREYNRRINNEKLLIGECKKSNKKSNKKNDTHIELELELETKLKLEKNIKHKHGEYQNVALTDNELENLKKDYDNYLQLIKYLDEYKEMKGIKYKSDYLAIKKWVTDAVKRNVNTTNTNFTSIMQELYEEEVNKK